MSSNNNNTVLYLDLVKQFPEMYHGDGTIFRALYELKRLLTRSDVKAIEIAMLANDIETDLINHSYQNMFTKEVGISLSLGKMTDDEYDDMIDMKREMCYTPENDDCERF